MKRILEWANVFCQEMYKAPQKIPNNFLTEVEISLQSDSGWAFSD